VGTGPIPDVVGCTPAEVGQGHVEPRRQEGEQVVAHRRHRRLAGDEQAWLAARNGV